MKPPAPETSITQTIVDTTRLLRRRFEIALSKQDTGLTVGESRALAFIWHFEGYRQAALAERMGVEPMTVVGYLDSLEKAGLITRKPDPGDRRAKLVVLTDKADPVLDKIGVAMTEVRSEVLAGLSEDQKTTLDSLLCVLKNNLLAGEAGASNK